MAAIATIVAFDGASTPVSHSFVPDSVTRDGDDVIAVYREQVTTVPVYAQAQLTLRRKRMGSGVWRVSSRLEVPVMESIGAQNSAGYTAAPKVAYINTKEDVGFFHERSTISERRLCRQLSINISNGVATSVAPVTTHAVGELFDLLIAPN